MVSGSLASSLLSTSLLRADEDAETETGDAAKREKKPAVVKAVFLYPLPKDCDQGKAEASWQEHNPWITMDKRVDFVATFVPNSLHGGACKHQEPT